MYALDTNSAIYFFKGMGRVAEHLLAAPPMDVALPAIVIYELEVGIAKSMAPKKRRQQLDVLLGSAVFVALRCRGGENRWSNSGTARTSRYPDRAARYPNCSHRDPTQCDPGHPQPRRVPTCRRPCCDRLVLGRGAAAYTCRTGPR